MSFQRCQVYPVLGPGSLSPLLPMWFQISPLTTGGDHLVGQGPILWRMASAYPTAPNTVRLFFPEELEPGSGAYPRTYHGGDLGTGKRGIFSVSRHFHGKDSTTSLSTLSRFGPANPKVRELVDHPDLKGLKVLYCPAEKTCTVTVRMYNPFVRDEEIRAFLLRYSNYVSP